MPKTEATPTVSEAAQELGRAIMRELDTGGTDYLMVRRKLATMSGIDTVAITFDEHLDIIAEKLARLKRLEDAYVKA